MSNKQKKLDEALFLQERDVETGLSIPNTYTTKKDTIVAIKSNFNLSSAQIEYSRTKGIFAPASIAYSIDKAIKSLARG